MYCKSSRRYIGRPNFKGRTISAHKFVAPFFRTGDWYLGVIALKDESQLDKMREGKSCSEYSLTKDMLDEDFGVEGYVMQTFTSGIFFSENSHKPLLCLSYQSSTCKVSVKYSTSNECDSKLLLSASASTLTTYDHVLCFIANLAILNPCLRPKNVNCGFFSIFL